MIDYPVIPTDRGAIEALYFEVRENYANGQEDPSILATYIACMALLDLTQELFFLSHRLSSTKPNNGLSWYCVGVYYWSCGKYDQAQRFLKKSIRKDKELGLSWILLGHVLSTIEESEQALAAYRTAVRLYPEHYLPLLCIGKEFIRTNNQWLAIHSLQSASHLSPLDIHIANELGVSFAKMGRYAESLDYFQAAILQAERSISTQSCDERLCQVSICCDLYSITSLIAQFTSISFFIIMQQFYEKLGTWKAVSRGISEVSLSVLRVHQRWALSPSPIIYSVILMKQYPCIIKHFLLNPSSRFARRCCLWHWQMLFLTQQLSNNKTGLISLLLFC